MLFEQFPKEDVMYNQHSPASGPVARSFNKRFVKRDDGEYAIQVDLEVYDEELFQQMGGYSISYTTDHYSVDLNHDADLNVLFNPREFSPDEFKCLARKADDGYQINVVKWHQKGLAAAAIVVLKFVGITSAAWFIAKLLDGTFKAFRDELLALARERHRATGSDTTFQMMLPITVDGSEVEVVAEVSSQDFARLGTNALTIPDAEMLLAARLQGKNVRKAVLKVAPDEPQWILSHAITHEHKVLMFKRGT